MFRSRLLVAASALAFVAACNATDNTAAKQAGPVTHVTPAQGAPRADVNPGYVMGKVATQTTKVPTLQEMMEATPASRSTPGASDEDRLRAPALRDAALSYGARGGLAYASKQINEMLEARAAELSRIYDFSTFLIQAPGGVTVLPPVIVESRDTYEQSDAGKTLRVADTYYEIVEQARFAPVAPLWHAYLIRSYTAPEAPQDALLPKNDGERDLWRKFVAEGFARGVEQAQAIFQTDLRRLERDFTGMIRYAELLEKKQVSAPVVADTNFGVTGTGNDMRVGDRALRITQDPKLQTNPGQWQAPVSSQGPTQAATPPGGTPGLR